MLRVVEKPSEENPDLRMSLDELLRRGALRMLHQALETEVDEVPHTPPWRARCAGPGAGRAQREGARAAAGDGDRYTVHVRAPRVNDRRVAADGQRQRFTSEILPSYMRRAPKVTEVLPILYLRGLRSAA
jgi:putative transposase